MEALSDEQSYKILMDNFVPKEEHLINVWKPFYESFFSLAGTALQPAIELVIVSQILWE